MKKDIRRMSIEPDGKGGHMVEIQFRDRPMNSPNRGMEMSYREPDKKVFGSTEHAALKKHIAEHLELSEDKPNAEKSRERAITASDGEDNGE